MLVEKWYANVSDSIKTDTTDILNENEDIDNLKEINHEIDSMIYNRRILLRYGVAAAIVALIGLLVVYFERSNDGSQQFTLIATQMGEVKKVYLPDSTGVWLNEGSELSYAADFGVSSRCVMLSKGEAYFDVVHNPSVPFMVKAGITSTKVLGTAFNIKTLDSGNVKINVERGKVRLSYSMDNDSGFVYLQKNEQFYIESSTRTLEKRVEDSWLFTSWKEDLVRVNNESLYNVSRLLESRFGVEVQFENEKISKKHYTIAITRSDSLANVLNAISETGGLEYKLVSKKVTFFHKKNKTQN